jgi:hypothetical protein
MAISGGEEETAVCPLISRGSRYDEINISGSTAHMVDSSCGYVCRYMMHIVIKGVGGRVTGLAGNVNARQDVTAV